MRSASSGNFAAIAGFGLAHQHVGVAAQLDVGAATGHVGGDGDGARPAGLGHDLGFLVVEARIQHVVRDLGLLEFLRQRFRLLDRHRADQHRLLAHPAVLDQLDDGARLVGERAVDLVVGVLAGNRHVGRDLDHFEPVDLAEFGRLGHRRAGHAGQLGIHAEEVLEGDRGQRLVLALDLDLFLGLERLVQALGIAPAGHHAAGELVDDDDLAVLDDVVDVAGEQLVGAQRLRHVVEHRDLRRRIEADALGQQAVAAQDVLDRLDAGIGQHDGAVLLVLLEMVGLEARDHGVGAAIELRRILGRAGDDQRRARLVDQDRIDLVDDGVVEGPLGHGIQAVLHVVAQVVETQLVVGAVGDVAGVGRLALLVVELVHDHADAEAEERVDLAHPLGVALGEVVVHRHDMHALAFEGVEIDRQGGDQRLAFAGLHLGDLALMKHHAALELDVEVTLAERAL